MLYFILWTVLLLAVVLAVPIVSMVESNRRKRALAPAQDRPESESPQPADEEPMMAEDAFGEVQVDEAAAVPGGGEFGGEDFSAFDDAFENPKQ